MTLTDLLPDGAEPDEVYAAFAEWAAKQGLELKLLGMPTTILINKDGLEVGRLAGSAKWDSEDAKKLIASAMN